MAPLKKFGILALALGCALVALWRSRRAQAAAKRAHAGGFVSRRIADRDARDQALGRWDDDGGANGGGANAVIR